MRLPLQCQFLCKIFFIKIKRLCDRQQVIDNEWGNRNLKLEVFALVSSIKCRVPYFGLDR